MKHLLICLAATIFMGKTAQAQDQFLYWKYKDFDGSLSFSVPGFVPKFASLFVKGKEERRLVRRTGRTRIMVFEDGSPISQRDFSRFARKAEKRGLDELITVREGKTNVRIMAKENGKRIRKLLIWVQDGEEFVMVSVKGRFKYKDLNAIIKKYQDAEGSGKDKKKEHLPVKIPVIRV